MFFQCIGLVRPATWIGLDSEAGLFTRLLDRLAPRELLHDLTALAFFGAPNDLAISAKSIGDVPMDRKPRAELEELACEHLTYFSTEVGQQSLNRALE